MSNESLNTNEGERNMKQYDVLVSELVAKYVTVTADSEEGAIEKVKQGEWTDDDIIKEDVVDRKVEDAEEVKI
jgi:hypothetical protein